MPKQPDPAELAHAAATLAKARTLISSPETWLKVGLARNSLNTPIHPCLAEACRFCAIGAVAHAVRGDLTPVDLLKEERKKSPIYFIYDDDLSPLALHALFNALPDNFQPCDKPKRNTLFSYIYRFNDNRMTTHAEVLALFDRAIASLSNT